LVYLVAKGDIAEATLAAEVAVAGIDTDAGEIMYNFNFAT